MRPGPRAAGSSSGRRPRSRPRPPAMARKNNPSHRWSPTRPNAAMPAPHTTTAQITASPCRRTCFTHPVVSAPTSAPTAGAANRSPTTTGPPSNWVAARSGNSARGIPKTIAMMSIIERGLQHAASAEVAVALLHGGPSGRGALAPARAASGGSSTAASSIATYVTRSMP